MIAFLIGIFGSIYLIIKFIKSILVKYIVFAVILSVQFAITSATIVFVLAFYTFAITSLIMIYNKGIEIFTYASTSTNSSLDCLFGLANCVGLIPALENGFIIAYSALSTIVIFHLLKFTFSAMKIIANELFKLGLLLGQSLK